jgi:phosphotransacetylase
VSGAADILLFPNLVSANLTVKAIMYTADCRFGGVLCGATVPVVVMSLFCLSRNWNLPGFRIARCSLMIRSRL